MGDELLEILEGQKQLDRRFQQLTVASERGSLRDTARGVSTATEGGTHWIASHTRILLFSASHFPAARSAKSVAENMAKLQGDRMFIERVINKTAREMEERGTFTSLAGTLQQHWKRREQMEAEILQ